MAHIVFCGVIFVDDTLRIIIASGIVNQSYFFAKIGIEVSEPLIKQVTVR